MKEPDRRARNVSRLAECHPAFAARLVRVVAELEAEGFRPRIQQAWRSVGDESQAYKDGRSHVVWSFHCATNPDGTPAALAADVLDDDHPITPTREYVLALAHAANLEDLSTGIAWDLPGNIKLRLSAAIVSGADWDGPIGWDPCHVETRAVTIAQARSGRRPSTIEASA